VAEGAPDELKSELRGDAVHIELDTVETNGRVAAALADLGDVRDVVVEHGRLLHARADNGARAVPLMLQALEARGVPVVSVTVARPSLDDVYLKYTGRRFEEADAAVEVSR
jgi:ABC-2 type transport system ATP-binding protein